MGWKTDPRFSSSGNIVVYGPGALSWIASLMFLQSAPIGMCRGNLGQMANSASEGGGVLSPVSFRELILSSTN